MTRMIEDLANAAFAAAERHDDAKINRALHEILAFGRAAVDIGMRRWHRDTGPVAWTDDDTDTMLCRGYGAADMAMRRWVTLCATAMDGHLTDGFTLAFVADNSGTGDPEPHTLQTTEIRWIATMFHAWCTQDMNSWRTGWHLVEPDNLIAYLRSAVTTMALTATSYVEEATPVTDCCPFHDSHTKDPAAGVRRIAEAHYN